MISKMAVWKLVVLVVFYLPLTMLVAQGLPPLTHKLTALTPAKVSPGLKLMNLDDQMVDINDLKGKVVVVNFWATWCPPCRREMGSLESLYQQTSENNIEVLAVNIGEDLDTVFSFLGTVEPSPTFQMLFDPEGASMKPWGVQGLPTTYILNKQGELVYRAVGGREFDHPDIVEAVMNLSQ